MCCARSSCCCSLALRRVVYNGGTAVSINLSDGWGVDGSYSYGPTLFPKAERC